MSYLFSDSPDVHAAAAFGQDVVDAMRERGRSDKFFRQTRRPRWGRHRRLMAQMGGLAGDPEEPKALYAKYAEKAGRWNGAIRAIRSTTAQKALRLQFDPLLKEQGRIAPAFASGASPGARDIDRLKEWVSGMSSFGRKLHAAEKMYGTGLQPPVPGSIPPPAPTPEAGGGIPIVPILAVGAALLLLR